MTPQEFEIDNTSNVGEALRWAAQALTESDIFLGHGFDNYWDEALALLLHVRGLGWDAGLEILDETLDANEREKFLKLVALRVKDHVPVAYLVGEAWFAGLPFYVDESVLIPRSPLAELVENGFDFCLDETPRQIIDLCTGSGCIGIACALRFSEAQVTLADISADALKIAEKNIQRYELDKRVKCVESDLFSSLPEQSCQLIVSNPPYVDAEDMGALPPEYLHEPELALEAGKDGLRFVSSILQAAPAFLDDQGVLIVEVGNSQDALMEAFPQLEFVWLEFERGGHGVFMVTKEQLLGYFG